MTQLIRKYALIVCAISSNAVIFSSDKHLGRIDMFVLQTEYTNNSINISKHPESYFPKKEPIFLFIDGTLQPINLPTYIKPFIVTIHNAQNIIDTNPHLFHPEKIKNKVAFISQNQSNSVIHTELGNRIIPIDHCTYIKENKESTDIVGLFFDKDSVTEHIAFLKKVEPLKDPLFLRSIALLEKKDGIFSRMQKEDLSIVHRANMAYYNSCIEENQYKTDASVTKYDFWKSASSD